MYTRSMSGVSRPRRSSTFALFHIAGMSLSRDTAGGNALTVLNLDSVPGEGLMQKPDAFGCNLGNYT